MKNSPQYDYINKKKYKTKSSKHLYFLTTKAFTNY